MQILLADSGSTKTDWAICRADGSVIRFQTMGLNPWFVSTEQFSEILALQLLPRMASEESYCAYFFGAGCGNQAHCDSLSSCFLQAGAEAVKVGTDLQGAALAAFGMAEGIIMILGTGANAGSCYNGTIIKTAPSTGFILGDEGSAAWIGKHLLSDYLRNQLPEALKQTMDSRFDLKNENILDHVYKQARPNFYIAKYASSLEGNEDIEYVQQLLKQGFEAFFKNYIGTLDAKHTIPVVAVGTVAQSHEKLLASVASSHGYRDFKILKSVIDGLIGFYSNQVI